MTMNIERQEPRRGRQKESLNTASTHDPGVLPCAQNPPFVFSHDPDNWELKLVDGKHTLLPRVKMIRLEPGVNGIRGDSYKAVDPRIFFATKMAEGTIIIHNDVPVVYYDEDGELVEDRGYLESEPCTNGRVYVSCWDRPSIVKSGRKRKVDWKTHKDTDGFNEWLLMLVAEGVIPKPTEAGLNAIVRLQQRRSKRMAGKTGDNDYLKKLVKNEAERLDALLAIKSELYARAPRRKRRKQKETFTDDVTPREDVKANPCSGITRTGARCQRAAKPGTNLCATHTEAPSE